MHTDYAEQFHWHSSPKDGDLEVLMIGPHLLYDGGGCKRRAPVARLRLVNALCEHNLGAMMRQSRRLREA